MSDLIQTANTDSHARRATPAWTEPFHRAVVVREEGCQLEDRKLLNEPQEGMVTVQVAVLGLCRTDLRVVNGQIPAALPIIPGHEFAGTVCSESDLFSVGDRVAVNPVMACDQCHQCAAGDSMNCAHPEFLGVDLDGACAEFITVPQTAVCRIPNQLSFEAAVFAEPVAACMAVLKSGIHPEQTGVILGDNRIALLTQRVLKAFDFQNVSSCAPEAIEDLPRNSLDFAIETLATSSTLASLAGRLKHRGTLVLKSRQHVPVELCLRDLLPGEPILQLVNYGSFAEAVNLLAAHRVIVDDLVGPVYALWDYESAFAAAEQNERQKVMISPHVETK